MKRQSLKFKNSPTGGHATSARGRRGSVIVLVVGVLAVVAISAVTYVNIVSLDRRSAAAVQRRVNYQQQADAVMNHIRALIGADLFGDKITSNATPQSVNGTLVWPRMFEDGEFTDMAFTNRVNAVNSFDGSFDELDPSDPDNRIGLRQDAWLASSEPLWLNNNTADTWPQITNLRSGYVYEPPAGNPGGLGLWKYRDGRFVDLAQWFVQDQNGLGNPAADLTMFNDPITGGSNDYTLALDQQIYDLQIDEIEPPFDVFNSRDQRVWVDTDGDLRPDARWQQLEVLGNNAGLIWVAAARIIDASALLNYNASLEFSYAAPGTLPMRTSDGRTPADIDAWALFEMADERMQNIANDNRVRGNGTLLGFRQHLEESLLIPEAIEQMTTLDPTYPDVMGITTYMGPWIADTQQLTADQRTNLWRYAGSSPLEPAASKASSHSPRRDMIDLFSFWGTNHRSIFSSIEQDIDRQFPPQANTGPNAPKGALRAAEDPALFRSLSNDRPTVQAIKADTRRLLTPFSGVGSFSPVPVINNTLANGFNEYEQVYSMLKPEANFANASMAEDIFASFVWALAPLATDEPMMPPMRRADAMGTAFDPDIFHYGGAGAPLGPARWTVAEDINQEVGATYAIRTSLALTANMIDCADTNDEPTVLRFFPRSNAADRPFRDISGTPAVELSDRLPQGNIRPTALAYPVMPIVPGATSAVGNTVTAADIPTTGNIADAMGALKKGITVVGLERQPFLREAFSAAFYSDFDEVAGEDFGNADGIISANGPVDHSGYLFAVELANPWDTPIRIGDYQVVLPGSQSQVNAGGNLTGLRFFAPDIEIPAGGVAVLYATNLNGDLRQAAIDAMPGSAGQVVTDQFANVTGAIAGERIIFREYAASGAGRLPVLLTHAIGATSSGTEYAVVDIMRPETPGSDQDGFPRVLTQDHFATQLAGSPFLFADSVITNDNPGDTRLPGRQPQHIGARLMISSSFSRPGGQPGTGSFPAYCLELNKGDDNLLNYSPRENFPDYTTNFTAQWGWILASGNAGDAPVYQNATVTNAPELLVPMSWTDMDAGGTGSGVHSDLGEADKYADSNAGLLAEIPPFQLYCRDGVDAFPTPASVAQLSTIAHFCLNHELNEINNWMTVSEQLTRDRFYNSGTPGTLNPYMGTLDISRFILNDATTMTGMVADLPDAMSMPLGVRVFDCFETLDSASSLNQGQVNLNTAPVEVLAQLPFLWPRLAITDINGVSIPQSPSVPLGRFDQSNLAGAPRLDSILQYRDNGFNVMSPAGAANAPFTITNIQQLRAASGQAADLRTPGFVSMGEVSILDQWTASQPNANTNTDLFQALGVDGMAADGHPFDITTEPTGFTPYTPTMITTNPQDDIEEKLALFRGMVNCASTRSDVYLAWFVVRGYDPDLIETFNVSDYPTPADALSDERFVPTYESRWLCLFDRSNMRRPTDRPELLMYIELPKANP